MTINKKQISKILFHSYLLLFIFTMINREFLFLGLDLRFPTLILGCILIIISLFKQKQKNSTEDKSFTPLFIVYSYAIISSIFWLFNGLTANYRDLVNELIILSFILIFIIVVHNYRNILNLKFLSLAVIGSCVFLFASMILVSIGIDLSGPFGSSNVPFSAVGIGHINMFGEQIRIAGFASDANYASLAMMIGIVFALKTNYKKIVKTFFVFMFSLGLGLSFSKTIIFSLVALIPIIIIIKLKPKTQKYFAALLTIGIFAITFVSPLIPNIRAFLPDTLSTRIAMWQSANDLFWKSPLLGSGITSFKSFFAINNWYVHPHSTYWQILSELGILIFIVFYSTIYKTLKRTDSLSFLLLATTAIWISTCASFELQMVVFIIYFSAIRTNNHLDKNSKSVLFFVNSLKQGGAEKVCVNMINEFIKKDYSVDIVTLYSQNNPFSKSKNVNLYCAKIDIKKNKLLKYVKLFLFSRKIDSTLSENSYALITSHLPNSNLLTHFTSFRKDAIYVMHSSINKKIVIPFYLFYKNKKLVAVSEGLRQEIIKNFHIKKEMVKTIYNPIVIKKDSIDRKTNDNIPKQKYFLHIGRFEEEKRQDRMLKIFKEGNFSKNYLLVFCGEGSRKNAVKQLAHNLDISSSVLFMDYQDNIEKLIHNSSLVISTSDREALPTIIIEAFMLDAKVVSGNYNYGPKEIMQGDFAKYLAQYDNEKDFVEKINLALKNYPKHQNSFVKNCNPSLVIEEYLKFCEDNV